MNFWSLENKQTVVNNSSVALQNIRPRKITGNATPVEVLAANEERKSLGFVNRASQNAYVNFVDATSGETPPTGVAVADYSFIVPAKSQGVCGLGGIPTGAVTVFYNGAADAEFIAIEGW